MIDFPLVTKCDRLESMADNTLYLNMSLVILKCLFKVWLFHKGVINDKIAMIATLYALENFQEKCSDF